MTATAEQKESILGLFNATELDRDEILKGADHWGEVDPEEDDSLIAEFMDFCGCVMHDEIDVTFCEVADVIVESVEAVKCGGCDRQGVANSKVGNFYCGGSPRCVP